MKKLLILLVIVCFISGCGVRLPDDFEYNLRVIADTNQEMLERIDNGEVPNDKVQEELRNIIESDIRDFRNAAATVEAGR